MTTSNENHDPRSLSKRSNLPTYSGHNRNSKHKVRKGPAAKPGLKESLLHNVTSEPDRTHGSHVGTQLHTPPASQFIAESHDKLVEETRLPISPPPEEEIRIKELSVHGHTSKDLHSRLSTGTLTTPVRNPRKRARSVTCTRPGSLPKRRPRAGRSTTPEVPYEPPTEQFTPPRDVVMQIPSSAISSRSRDPKTLKIKTERLTSPFPPPALDLSKPAPPPSPTDDPLLLVGPPKVVRCNTTPSSFANKSLVDVSLGVEDVVQGRPHASVCASPTTPHRMEQSLWNFGPTMMDDASLMRVAFDGPDATFDSEDSDTCDDVNHGRAHHRPEVAPDPFDPNKSTGSHIFHSDDEDVKSGEDEGEYTGRFRFYSVPVEKDPPSSATRARRVSWGRPISPFPFSKRSPRLNTDPVTDRFAALHDGPRGALQDFRDNLNGDDGVSDEEDHPTGLVEVSSDDPKAAARAAAILKLHHSYVVDGPVAQRPRRRSHSFRQSFVAPKDGHILHGNVKGNTEVSPSQAEINKTWTNGHWRMLDMCFTDERLLIGRAMGLDNPLADVDDIAIGSVVERFLAKMEDGGDWDRDKLLRRVTALSARQRAGKGAPPSPNVLVHQNPEVVVPVCTSLAVSRMSSPEAETGMTSNLPPSLLAPRYAHLHEEVTTTSLTTTQVSAPIPRYSTSNVNTTSKHNLNVLPLPLPEMRQVVRGPINTPAKKPVPRGQHPRDLVRLVETQLPAKPVQFPKGQSAKDLVNLNHIEPPRSVRRPRSVSGPIFIPGRNRKDSGGSVKDLVKSFEAVHKSTAEEIMKSSSRLGVRKTASVGNLHANRFGSHVV